MAYKAGHDRLIDLNEIRNRFVAGEGFEARLANKLGKGKKAAFQVIRQTIARLKKVCSDNGPELLVSGYRIGPFGRVARVRIQNAFKRFRDLTK